MSTIYFLSRILRDQPLSKSTKVCVLRRTKLSTVYVLECTRVHSCKKFHDHGPVPYSVLSTNWTCSPAARGEPIIKCSDQNCY
jgi:hypothetical protein